MKTPKTASSVDISSRISGAQSALQDMGLAGLSQEIKNTNMTRMGAPAHKPPPTRMLPQHEYTTSGTGLNPKVASDPIGAPNYSTATSKTTGCTSCKHFTKQSATAGTCDRYDFMARVGYTCDGWQSATSKPVSQFKS